MIRGLILGEEERRAPASARASSMLVEPDHLQAGAVDEERNAVQVAHADEVGAVLDQRDELLRGRPRPACGR